MEYIHLTIFVILSSIIILYEIKVITDMCDYFNDEKKRSVSKNVENKCADELLLRFQKEIPSKLPQTILAEVCSGGGNKSFFQVLYLHTTNEYDKISTCGTYYYDDSGEEIPLSTIKRFLPIDVIECSMYDMESFLKKVLKK